MPAFEGEERRMCSDSLIIDHTVKLATMEQDVHTLKGAVHKLVDMADEFKKLKYALYGIGALLVVQTFGVKETLSALF